MKTSLVAVLFLMHHLAEADEVTPVSSVIFPSHRGYKHISDFTDPKTGLNPYVDLKEGTPSSTSRTAVLKEESSDESHLGSSKTEHHFHREDASRFEWRPNPQTHVVFPQVHHTPPRMPPWAVNPVEGDATHRSRQPPEFDGSWGRRSHSWPSGQRPPFQQSGPQLPSQQPPAESPYIPRTPVLRSRILNRGTTEHPQPPAPLSTVGSSEPSPLPKQDTDIPSKEPMDDDVPKETILSTETKWTLAFCGIISGVAVVFFATLLAVCMYKQRRKRFVQQGSRFIEDSDVQTFGKPDGKGGLP